MVCHNCIPLQVKDWILLLAIIMTLSVVRKTIDRAFFLKTALQLTVNASASVLDHAFVLTEHFAMFVLSTIV
jgi:hypothetical protein